MQATSAVELGLLPAESVGKRPKERLVDGEGVAASVVRDLDAHRIERGLAADPAA